MYVTYKYNELSSQKQIAEILKDIVTIIKFKPQNPPNSDYLYNEEFKAYVTKAGTLSLLASISSSSPLLNTSKIIDGNTITFPETNIKILSEWEDSIFPNISSTVETSDPTKTVFYLSNTSSDFQKNIEFSVSSSKSTSKTKPEDIAGYIRMVGFHYDDSGICLSSYGYTDAKFIQPAIYYKGGYIHISVSKNHLMVASTNSIQRLWKPGIGVCDFEPYYYDYNGQLFKSYYDENYPSWCYMSMNGADNISLPKIYDMIKEKDLYYSYDPLGKGGVNVKTITKESIKNVTSALKICDGGITHGATCDVGVNVTWWTNLKNALLAFQKASASTDQSEIDKCFEPSGAYALAIKNIETLWKAYPKKDITTEHYQPSYMLNQNLFDNILMRIPTPPNVNIAPNTVPNKFQIKSQYIAKLNSPANINIPYKTLNYNFNKALVCARIGIQNKYIKTYKTSNDPTDEYLPEYYDIGGEISEKCPIYMISSNCKSLDHLSLVLPQHDTIPLYDDIPADELEHYKNNYGDYVVWDSLATTGTNLKTASKFKYIVLLG